MAAPTPTPNFIESQIYTQINITSGECNEFSCYEFIEEMLSTSITNFNLKNLFKDIFFMTKDATINLNSLNKLIPWQIVNWIQIVYFSTGKHKENKEDPKRTYYTYRSYNIKLFILQVIDNFDRLRDVGDHTVVNKHSKHFDPVIIQFILLIFSDYDMNKKCEILFEIFDYKNKNQLKSNSKSLNLFLRKFLIVNLFMADALLNHYLKESLETPDLNVSNFNHRSSKVLNYENSTITGNPTAFSTINSNKVMINSHTILFKKMLFYLKETHGAMKDFINFISHSLIFYENLSNQKLEKTKFLELMKNKDYALLNPKIIRSYLVKYMNLNYEKTNYFINSTNKLIRRYIKKFILEYSKHLENEKETTKNLILKELDMIKDYQKYMSIFNRKENFEFLLKDKQSLLLKKNIQLYEKDQSRKKLLKQFFSFNSLDNIIFNTDTAEELNGVSASVSKKVSTINPPFKVRGSSLNVIHEKVHEENNIIDEEKETPIIKNKAIHKRSKKSSIVRSSALKFQNKPSELDKDKDLFEIKEEVKVIDIDVENKSVNKSHDILKISSNKTENSREMSRRLISNATEKILNLDNSSQNRNQPSESDVTVLKESKIYIFNEGASNSASVSASASRQNTVKSESTVKLNKKDFPNPVPEYVLRQTNDSNYLRESKLDSKLHEASILNQVNKTHNESRMTSEYFDSSRIIKNSMVADSFVKEEEINFKWKTKEKESQSNYPRQTEEFSRIENVENESNVNWEEEDSMNQINQIFEIKKIQKNSYLKEQSIDSKLEFKNIYHTNNENPVTDRILLKEDSKIIQEQVFEKNQNNTATEMAVVNIINNYESILEDYHSTFFQISSLNLNQLTLEFIELESEKIILFIKANSEYCKKELIYLIIENKISIEIINFYFHMLNNYNSFLCKNEILTTSVKFLDTQFFKNLQEIYILDKNYHPLLEKYTQFFHDNYVLVIPIYLENPYENDNKFLFLAKINFANKTILMFDACDILIEDKMILTNYRIIFESFFQFLADNHQLSDEYRNWKIEVEYDCTCYDTSDDYPIITMLHCAESICKDEKIEISEANYEEWKELIFMQIAQLYIKIFNFN